MLCRAVQGLYGENHGDKRVVKKTAKPVIALLDQYEESEHTKVRYLLGLMEMWFCIRFGVWLDWIGTANPKPVLFAWLVVLAKLYFLSPRVQTRVGCEMKIRFYLWS